MLDDDLRKQKRNGSAPREVSSSKTSLYASEYEPSVADLSAFIKSSSAIIRAEDLATFKAEVNSGLSTAAVWTKYFLSSLRSTAS